MIHLYTTFYNEKKEARNQELLSCIQLNLKNTKISKVVIFNEGGDLSKLETEKLVEIKISSRPTYNNFIQYINQYTNDTDIHIITNTDIFFNSNIDILNELSLNERCLALSRWDTTEFKKPKLYNHNDSQDVWVFQGKIKKTLNAPYPLGVPRCDNRFLYDLELAGYQTSNPSYSIKAFHMHKGQRALVYSEADNKYGIKPPYRYKYPHNLFGLFKTVYHNLNGKPKIGNYRYDIKKINLWIPVRVIRKSIKVLLNKDLPLIGYNND